MPDTNRVARINGGIFDFRVWAAQNNVAVASFGRCYQLAITIRGNILCAQLERFGPKFDLFQISCSILATYLIPEKDYVLGVKFIPI